MGSALLSLTHTHTHFSCPLDRPIRDAAGHYSVQWGMVDVRLAQDPFPLYPGELVDGDGAPSPLPTVGESQALHLRARTGA